MEERKETWLGDWGLSKGNLRRREMSMLSVLAGLCYHRPTFFRFKFHTGPVRDEL